MGKNISEEVAKLLLSIGVMTFRFDPPYTYTTGLKSPVYLDNRLVMSYPEVRKKIVNYYIKVLKEEIGLENVEWISATASAAIPQGAWVSWQLNLPMVFVRPSTKSYGKGNKVEGYIKKGSKVVIIEDHISPAESVAGNAAAMRELGGVVEYCVTTTSYQSEKSLQTLKNSGIKLIPLTTGKILAETALKMGKITSDQKGKIDAWFTDPPNWAKKMGLE